MFYGCEFSFNGISCATFGLALYNFGSSRSSGFDFASPAQFDEDSSRHGYRNRFYGQKQKEPMEIKLTFGLFGERLDRGVDVRDPRYLRRSEINTITSWLTGTRGYRRLEIDQPDMKDYYYKAHCTKLSLIGDDWYPYGFEATFECDSPYAYQDRTSISVEMRAVPDPESGKLPALIGKTVYLPNDSAYSGAISPIVSIDIAPLSTEPYSVSETLSVETVSGVQQIKVNKKHEKPAAIESVKIGSTTYTQATTAEAGTSFAYDSDTGTISFAADEPEISARVEVRYETTWENSPDDLHIAFINYFDSDLENELHTAMAFRGLPRVSGRLTIDCGKCLITHSDHGVNPSDLYSSSLAGFLKIHPANETFERFRDGHLGMDEFIKEESLSVDTFSGVQRVIVSQRPDKIYALYIGNNEYVQSDEAVAGESFEYDCITGMITFAADEPSIATNVRVQYYSPFMEQWAKEQEAGVLADMDVSVNPVTIISSSTDTKFTVTFEYDCPVDIGG